MLSDQINHHYGQGTCGTRYHAWTTTDCSSDQTNHEGRVESDQRIDASNKGKSNGFGHQGQRHGQAREEVIFTGRAFSYEELEHQFSLNDLIKRGRRAKDADYNRL